MMRRGARIANCVLLLVLAGCSSLAPLLSPPRLDQPQGKPVPTNQADTTPKPFPIVTVTAPSQTEARILRLWLPPRFNPSANTVSAKLLRQRLLDFEAANQGLKIDVRIKAEEGDVNLLNTLSITRDAAPSALPDLIALSRADLESAAIKGLLHPIDGLSTKLHDPSWYPYARELGHIQNIGYGLPFAGNALVLIHRPELNIVGWDGLFANGESLLFSAGDPQALVALSFYVSAGGKLVDEQGKPTLEEGPLTKTLAFIQTARETETFSPSLTGFELDEQSLQAYRSGRANAVITWSENHEEAGGRMQPIPNLGAPHTFADGWMWALAGSQPEKQQFAVQLAEYLIEDEFLDKWMRGQNYVPARVSGDSDVNVILEAAQAIPSNDVLAVLGPIVNQALSRVLNGEQVEVVVRSVMEQVR
jgi:ABC-type glycerol-3-phosphate transport system substrate-binding protein